MNETDSPHCCRSNLGGSRGATMTRTGRNQRREASGVDRVLCSDLGCCVPKACRCSCPWASERKDERELCRVCLALLCVLVCFS